MRVSLSKASLGCLVPGSSTSSSTPMEVSFPVSSASSSRLSPYTARGHPNSLAVAPTCSQFPPFAA